MSGRLTFEDMWKYTSTIDGWFGEEESRALFEQANSNCGDKVEIGCWAGKSSSILLQCAVNQGSHVTLIDPFVWMEGGAIPAFKRNIEDKFQYYWNWRVYKMRSAMAVQYVCGPISLLHIDGDHTHAGITNDCLLYLPMLRSGGVVCAHDYGNPAYPDIVTVLDEYTKGWEDLGVYNTLAIRRKP